MKKKSIRTAGRPRSFDVDKALDQAMLVFWQKGYEGASMTDLTKAMGINRPSLYAAFGGKESLFRRAIDRYAKLTLAFMEGPPGKTTSRGYAEALLRGAADWHTNPRTPRGCLMVVGALAVGGAASGIQRELNKRRAEDEVRIRERLEQAQAVGDLPEDANPADLARYLVTVIRGMVVQAVGGANREELEGVIRTALRAWPD